VLAVGLAAALLAQACATREPVPTRPVAIAPGDSLWRIARRSGVSLDSLVRANPDLDPARLRVGSVIRVPARDGLLQGASWPSPGRRREVDAFLWPVAGPVGSSFGERNGRPHEGIDLEVPAGTPVRASEFGRVVTSTSMGSYGNIVAVRHAGTFVTVYAHNEANLVAPGDWVSRGQVIARVGQTGNATGPHLHFEIRRDRRPRNPLYYLPIGESPWRNLARARGLP
jgi:murein DD-endopeptidase MepM/ murein hydrolase activator NlpD